MKLQLEVALVVLGWMNVMPLHAGLVITEVASTSGAPAGGPLESRDWWELTNTGPASVLLDGYAWEDNPVSNERAVFPNGVTIAAGESIIIHQAFADTPVSAAFRTTWSLPASVRILEESQFTGSNPFSGLGGSGDGVNLFDGSGTLVASASFGAATSGVTFEWAQNGTNLGLSLHGENGAYTSTYGGVGSPGYSVPEPASAILYLLGIAGLTLITRPMRRVAA